MDARRGCPECNAQAGDPCADPLEDRLRYHYRRAFTLAGPNMEAWKVSSAGARRIEHAHLDRLGVPRHGTTAKATDTPFRMPEGSTWPEPDRRPLWRRTLGR